MNDLERYAAILNECFGAGSACFDTNTGVTNNIIGALNHITDYASFRGVFVGRCKRLAALYPVGNPNRKPLLDRLNEMASANKWDGVYAEMVALDFLHSNTDYFESPINLSKTVPACETLSGALGGSQANWDGFYDDFSTCFDVKILGDKSGNILQGIINEVTKSLRLSNVHISPEYPSDINYDIFERSRNALKSELEAKINISPKPTFIKSEIVPELDYRLQWGSGVLSTISTYDPYQHAENHHTLLFKHAKKFARKHPVLIVFVVFPWFSESVVNAFCRQDIFFRSFCRRFFCQYIKDSRPANCILKSHKGPETVAEVTKLLSGVLFLVDDSIMTKDSTSINVDGFAYLNPNACNKLRGHFRDYLSSVRCFTDDFEHDNY
jgi:hypothetical protein